MTEIDEFVDRHPATRGILRWFEREGLDDAARAGRVDIALQGLDSVVEALLDSSL